MTHLETLRILAQLPHQMAAHTPCLFLENKSAWARDVIRRDTEAGCEAFAFAVKNGASGYVAPIQGWPNGRITNFVFHQKPKFRGWVKTEEVHPAGPIYVAGETTEGQAITRELEKIPPLVRIREVLESAGALDEIDIGSDSVVVGRSEEGRVYTPAFGHTDKRLFLIIPNPFYDVLSLTKPDVEIPEDVLAWRPAPPWKFVSKAEIDLAFVEERERKGKNLRRALK